MVIIHTIKITYTKESVCIYAIFRRILFKKKIDSLLFGVVCDLCRYISARGLHLKFFYNTHMIIFYDNYLGLIFGTI